MQENYEIIAKHIIQNEEIVNNDTNDNLSIRRNSISLPNLDDLVSFNNDEQITPLQSKSQDCNYILNKNSNINIYNNDDDDDDDNDEVDELIINYKNKFSKNQRRKSVSDLYIEKMQKINNNEKNDNDSPANSITSINSLASLLREKIHMLPASFRKKKSYKDYKTRIFVGFLFLTIIILISCAYVLYNQKVLQRAYFEKIKFNKVNRIIKIYNNDGLEIIKGNLGTTINFDKALPCLISDEKNDSSICLEWMDRLRLYLKFYIIHKEIKCYNLHWVSLSNYISPCDCYDFNNDHWYGGGQTSESAWPLEKANHDFSPFITGIIPKHEWGNVLKRYFINSKGAALIISELTPLYIKISGKENKKICFKANYDNFAYVNHLTNTPHLNYSICTSSNMTRLHSLLIENTLWDGLKKEDVNIINSLLTEPLWEIKSSSKNDFTEETISNYTENVISLGFLKQGHVLINEFWQKDIGDFEVDIDRFPTLPEAINIMHRRGFRIVFSIQPFISTESFNFAEAVKQHLLISERFSDKRIPALTRYKSLQSAGVLDITNNNTLPWLLKKLKSIMIKYKFDAFYLDLGVAYNMPHYYQCEKPLINPDQYKTLFINSLLNNVAIFGVNSAIERPRAPTFVSLPTFESSWIGLRRVIPALLTYGMNGYPFLIPGAVGGDFNKKNITFTNDILPDKELYVRWLQLATFLPVIRYTYLPSTYSDNKMMEMAKLLTSLRQAKVSPLLKKYARIALDTGLPLIRPLWMLDTNDPACRIVIDEFSIGIDLLVAPVLYSGAREREIYLPAGVWKDGIDGSLRKGSRWIHNYRVEIDQVAYFEKMPDDTRF